MTTHVYDHRDTPPPRLDRGGTERCGGEKIIDKSFHGFRSNTKVGPPIGDGMESQPTRPLPHGKTMASWVKEICPRGNNKVVIYISLYHDKCLLFMLELY